jgi:hypothetical protein
VIGRLAQLSHSALGGISILFHFAENVGRGEMRRRKLSLADQRQCGDEDQARNRSRPVCERGLQAKLGETCRKREQARTTTGIRSTPAITRKAAPVIASLTFSPNSARATAISLRSNFAK